MSSKVIHSNISKLMTVLSVVLLVFVATGCEKQPADGPAEQAGKKIDHTMEKAELKTQQAASAIKEMTKDAADATGKAVGETGRAIEKTGEAIQQK